MAKWVYQMTPHDEWDFDGVNEMILADLDIGGSTVQGAGPLRPQRPRLYAEPRDGRAARRREIRSGGELDLRRRHGQEQPDLRAPEGSRPVLDGSAGRGRERARASARRRSGPRTSSRRPIRRKRKLFYVPTNHVCMDYEPFKVAYTAGQAYVGATLVDVSGPEQPWRHGQLHCLGRHRPARSCGRSPSSSRPGAARSPRPATSSSTARSRAI